MRDRPDISVIIPTHNRRASLQRTLEGLEAQTFRRFEVIVSVDGGTDGTWEYVSRLTRYPWLCACRLPLRKGAGAARNRGAQEATGTLLLFLDDDIFPAPDLLAVHVQEHRDRKPLALLGAVLPDPLTSCWDRLIVDEIARTADDEIHVAAWFTSWHFSLRKELFLKEGFDEDLLLAPREDRELGWRLYRRGIPMRYCPEARGWHRRALTAGGAMQLFFDSGKALPALLRKHPDICRDRVFGDILLPFLRSLRDFSPLLPKEWDVLRAKALKLDSDGLFKKSGKERAWKLLYHSQREGAFSALYSPSRTKASLASDTVRLSHSPVSIPCLFTHSGSLMDREVAANIRDAASRSGLMAAVKKNPMLTLKIDGSNGIEASFTSRSGEMCGVEQWKPEEESFPWCIDTRWFAPRPHQGGVSFPGRAGFLCMASFEGLNGVREMLRGFMRAFTPDSPVFLNIWVTGTDRQPGRLAEQERVASLPELDDCRPMPPVLVRYGAADRTVRARLYAESDFFLFTGDPETFLFLREAMASELPVIAPGSVPERLRDLICLSAGNTDELAGCLREAMVSRESLAGHGARSGRKAACLWSREAGLMWLSERITHYFDELV